MGSPPRIYSTTWPEEAVMGVGGRGGTELRVRLRRGKLKSREAPGAPSASNE